MSFHMYANRVERRDFCQNEEEEPEVESVRRW